MHSCHTKRKAKEALIRDARISKNQTIWKFLLD
jgi:hypothetical protein